MKLISEDYSRFLPEDSTGFNVRRNKRNGMTIVELHYTADPRKRDIEWIENERRKMPIKLWNVEMERSWETYSGSAVYQGVFHKHLHVPSKNIPAIPHQPIIRGWDFGGNQSVAIGQVQGSRIVQLDEIANKGHNTEVFAPEVIAYCNQNYPAPLYIDIIDPNGMWDTQRAKSNASNADVMREMGLRPQPAPSNDPAKRIDWVTKLMLRLCSDGLPAYLINPRCDMTIRGYEGGFHYPDKITQRTKIVPVKNLFSHICDAAQYMCSRMSTYESRDPDEAIDYERSQVNYKFS